MSCSVDRIVLCMFFVYCCGVVSLFSTFEFKHPFCIFNSSFAIKIKIKELTLLGGLYFIAYALLWNIMKYELCHAILWNMNFVMQYYGIWILSFNTMMHLMILFKGSESRDGVIKMLLVNPNLCGGVVACLLDNTVRGKKKQLLNVINKVLLIQDRWWCGLNIFILHWKDNSTTK